MALSSRRLKQIKMQLSSIDDFQNPKQHLEQYMTSVDMAIDIFNFIESEIGVEDKKVLDLGCGTGMLTMAAESFGAEKVVGVDIDDDVIESCRQMLSEIYEDDDDSSVEFNLENVLDMNLSEKFDVVITNPPFGTKDTPHIDSGFILTGFRHLSPDGRIYSLHKSSCGQGIIKKFKNKFPIITAAPVANLNWELLNTYKHHRRKSVNIEVVLVEWFIDEKATSGEREDLIQFAEDFAKHVSVKEDPLA